MGRSQRHKVRIQGIAADGEAYAEGMGVINGAIDYSIPGGTPINNKPVVGTPPYIVNGAPGGPLKGSLVLGFLTAGPMEGNAPDPVDAATRDAAGKPAEPLLLAPPVTPPVTEEPPYEEPPPEEPIP